MTKATKPVARETFSSIRERGKLRPLIIEIHPTYVSIRPKGTRQKYTVTMDQIFNLGAKNAVEARKRERAEEKKAKRKEKGGR